MFTWNVCSPFSFKCEISSCYSIIEGLNCSKQKWSINTYLTVQSLQMLLGSWGLALTGLFHSGQNKLGITEQSVGTL